MDVRNPSRRNNTHEGKSENYGEEGYHIGCLPHPPVLKLVSGFVRFKLASCGLLLL